MLPGTEGRQEMEIREMTAARIGCAIRRKDLSVREAVQAFEEEMEKQEPGVHAFLSVDRERVRERISQVERGIREGVYRGPLAGVPVAVKDNLCVRGWKTTCASRILENFVPAYSAFAVEKLEEAGMILLGKTNMDEFAMGSTTETSAFGATWNPWNPAHTPGGSSGGSCAAVAAGEVPLALGSDTGGSIRQPSGFCGVVGLKPTYGLVSRRGLVAYASSLDQIGPVAASVEDCALLLAAIAGKDPLDATSVSRPLPDYRQAALGEAKGLRIGVPEEYLAEGTAPRVREAVTAAVRLLGENGASVEYFHLKMTDYVIPAYYIIACAEASSNLARFDGVKYGYRSLRGEGLHEMYKYTRAEGFGEEVKRRILLGSFVLSAGYYDAYYMKALKAKRLIKEEFDRVLGRFDCIVAPVAPDTAPALGTSLSDPLKMYLGDICTVAVNLAGVPAISVPCGMDEKGLPIGMQFIGDRFGEEKILQAAGAYERLRGGFPRVWDRCPETSGNPGEPDPGQKEERS